MYKNNGAVHLINRSIIPAFNQQIIQIFYLQVQQEIFDVKKNMELLHKAIMDKSNPLKVAHSRLEARSHRRDVELCRDGAQTRYIWESN